MSLTAIAIVILSLWVVAIVAAGLVMALRPGGAGITLAVGDGAPTAPSLNRQEIPLGGEAQVLGNFRGRVGAVLVGAGSRRLEGVQLGGGILEGETVPANAILGADGNILSLSDGWQDRPSEEVKGLATLDDNMPLVADDGKRLGRLRLVCYEPKSGAVTALVIEGGASHRRLVPFDRVVEVGPDRVRTNLRRADADRLDVFATDWELRQAILERLASDPEFEGLSRALRVEVRDQRVQVRGSVADRARAQRLEDVIRAVSGVEKLESEIITDDQLGQAVRDALGRDPSTSAAHVDVTVTGGVVDITGEVPDRATLRRVDTVLQQVEGVQVVHNMVVVPVRKATAATP